jgi:endonuclease/exonuclease/phosphatase family metal-dependent hydrolase
MKKVLSLILIFAMLLSTVLLVACDDNAPDNGEQDQGNETPENPEKPEDGKGEGDENNKQEEPDVLKLKIGSFNIANGAYVSHNLKKLADDIKEFDLDIVGLQEVDRFASRSQYLDTMKKLSELTGYKYYYFSKAINIGGDPAKYGQDGEYGTGILSKYPITFEETTQLASGGYEQRVLGHAVIQVEDAEVHFFNAHLTYNTLNVRKAQMEAIEEKVWEYDYCLLTGDFNIEALEEFATIGSLTGVSNEDNPLHSYWKEETPPWPTECLDNIMYSSYFKLLDCGVVNDRKHSDHYMIWAEFEVK